MKNTTYKILISFLAMMFCAIKVEAFPYRDYKAFNEIQEPKAKVFELAQLPRVLQVRRGLNLRGRGRFGSPRLNYSRLRQKIRMRKDNSRGLRLGQLRNSLRSHNKLRDKIRRRKTGTIYRNNLGRISRFSGKINVRRGRINPRRNRVFTPRRRFITRR